jgi:hypothetical protein
VTYRFKFLMWLMIVGFLLGGFEIVSGRPFDLALGVPAVMFVIGLIGVCWTWPKEADGADSR